MFCLAVLWGNRLYAWNTIPMCVRTSFRSVRMSVISRSRNHTFPSVGSSSMFMHRSKVDFPEPEGPMMTRTSCGNSSKSIPFST
jgi:hypothetical protein